MLPPVETPKPESGQKNPEEFLETPETSGPFEDEKSDSTTGQEPAPVASTPVQPTVRVSPPKDETVVRVEKILEEDLGEAYQKLSPGLKVRFKLEGEQVTEEVVGMVKSLHIKASRVLKLISHWLRMLPGVNQFFLIQEAKIKTDRIVALGEEEKKNKNTH